MLVSRGVRVTISAIFSDFLNFNTAFDLGIPKGQVNRPQQLCHE